MTQMRDTERILRERIRELEEQLDALGEAMQKFIPYAESAEVRWMSVEDATIEVPARAVAELTRLRLLVSTPAKKPDDD